MESCIDNYYDIPSVSTNALDDVILYLKKYYKENMEFLYDPKIPAYSEIADMLNEIKDFNFFKDVTKNDIHLNEEYEEDQYITEIIITKVFTALKGNYVKGPYKYIDYYRLHFHYEKDERNFDFYDVAKRKWIGSDWKTVKEYIEKL